MRGKLIKEMFGGVGHYTLFIDSHLIPYAKDGSGHGYMKLSLKNCQAIENGYDLYELSEKEYLLHENNEELFGDSPDLISAYKAGVWDGLKRMAEIIGDKKFSEGDIRLAMHFGKFGETNGQTTTIGFIQSLQQFEWDVKVEVEIKTELSPGATCIADSDYINVTRVPKLDGNGFLMLNAVI
jgi:hypothetical protein